MSNNGKSLWSKLETDKITNKKKIKKKLELTLEEYKNRRESEKE